MSSQNSKCRCLVLSGYLIGVDTKESKKYIDKNEYEIKDTLLAKYVGRMPTNAKFDDLYEIWWILIVSSIYNINFLYL